jgi:hypothetical protein
MVWIVRGVILAFLFKDGDEVIVRMLKHRWIG